MPGLIEQGEFRPLKTRGITKETCQKFGYSINKDESGTVCHIAPYYNRKGDLIAQHLRGPEKSFSWRGKPVGACLFGQHLWQSDGKMLVITEGEIDCLTVSQAQDNKWPVVSIPNGAAGAKKAITENLDWIEGFERVILAFDNDVPGIAAAQAAAAVLSPGKARIATFPRKDANEMLIAGEVKQLLSCIWNARIYRPDGLISGKDLLPELLKPPVTGYELQYPLLSDMLKGIRKGELYLFTAGSGIGKSTLVNEIAYHFLMKHGLSIGIVALEESKKRTAERYIGMHLNKPIHYEREGITDEVLTEAYEAVLNTDRFWLYDHFGSTDLDNLLNKLRYMIVALQVDFIVLDHISIVVSGLDEGEESERKMIDKLMTRIRSLIEETGAGVLAIVHLKRPGQGKSYNEGRQVSLTDLRGSGALEQLSDVVIALERNQQDEEESNIAQIRVLKNRQIGIVGLCDSLEYSQDTGRLTVTTPFVDEDEGLLSLPSAKRRIMKNVSDF